MILDEIRELIQKNVNENGEAKFDVEKVRIALELTRTEIVQSLPSTNR